MMIPFGNFEPDKSPFDSASSEYILNTLPVAGGWGPMPGLLPISTALPDACKGAVYVQTASGTIVILAGTKTALYRLDVTNYTWEDISGPSAPYNVPDEDSWSFTLFGTQIFAHNLNDDIQAYDIEAAGDFADLAGNPPKAKYSWVAGDFLVLGYLEGAYGAKTVRWSALNNPEEWIIGKHGSDFQELPEGEEVMGGFGVPGGFYVMQRYAMQSFPYAPNSNFTFTRTVINPKQGCVAPRSIVSLGPNRFFYLSEDGFFSGAERTPIGAERVDRWFFSQLDPSRIEEVQGAADPFEKIIWWKFIKNDGTSYRLGYDWQLDRWCTTDIPVGEMVALATPGVTWDGLGELYGAINDIDVPFDSRTFNGGRPTFATFTDDNKLAFFSGESLMATLNTADIQIDGLARSYVSSARVTTDANNFTARDGVTDYPGGPLTWSAVSAPNPRNKVLPFRSDGQLHKFQVIIPAGEAWTIATGIDPVAQVSGEI
jgi:hypothetical protein